MSYAPAIVLVNRYFNKRRGIATGIATAGSGIGAFVFPPIFSWLIYNYGLFGSLLIIGALMFNLCVSASFYRPIYSDRQKRLKAKGSCQDKIEKTHTKDCEPSEHAGIKNTILSVASSCAKPSHHKSCLKNKYIDLSLLSDPVFLVFGIAQGILTMSYVGGQLLLLALAENRGIAESKGVFLLSAVGIADTVGRITSGLLFDCYPIRLHRVLVYNLAIFITALTYFGWAFCSSFELLILICVIHGLINGFVVSQRAVIASDILGVERLSSSFGLTVCFQGCGNIVGPFIAGK